MDILNYLPEQLIYKMGRARLLNDLSSICVGPIRSMNCRVNGSGIKYMGQPIYSATHRPDMEHTPTYLASGQLEQTNTFGNT